MTAFSEADIELLKSLTDQVDGARDRMHRAHTVEGVARALVNDCKTLIAATYGADDLSVAAELLLVTTEALKRAEAIHSDAAGALDGLVERLDSETARAEREAGGGS